jgi:hypothetical protein
LGKECFNDQFKKLIISADDKGKGGITFTCAANGDTLRITGHLDFEKDPTPTSTPDDAEIRTKIEALFG